MLERFVMHAMEENHKVPRVPGSKRGCGLLLTKYYLFDHGDGVEAFYLTFKVSLISMCSPTLFLTQGI